MWRAYIAGPYDAATRKPQLLTDYPPVVEGTGFSDATGILASEIPPAKNIIMGEFVLTGAHLTAIGTQPTVYHVFWVIDHDTDEEGNYLNPSPRPADDPMSHQEVLDFNSWVAARGVNNTTFVTKFNQFLRSEGYIDPQDPDLTQNQIVTWVEGGVVPGYENAGAGTRRKFANILTKWWKTLTKIEV